MTTTQLEKKAYHLLQDIRLLARRDDQVDKELEGFRMEFLEALEQFMDFGTEHKLTIFISDGERIVSKNHELVRWLRKELEAQQD